VPVFVLPDLDGKVSSALLKDKAFMGRYIGAG